MIMSYQKCQPQSFAFSTLAKHDSGRSLRSISLVHFLMAISHLQMIVFCCSISIHVYRCLNMVKPPLTSPSQCQDPAFAGAYGMAGPSAHLRGNLSCQEAFDVRHTWFLFTRSTPANNALGSPQSVGNEAHLFPKKNGIHDRGFHNGIPPKIHPC